MKSVLPILGLGLCLWSFPAAAGPYDLPDHSNAAHEVGRGLRIHHVAPVWRVHATGLSAIRVDLPTRAHRNPWANLEAEPGMRLAPPRILGVVSGIPEPSAMTLFGVGMVLALQAIPRRSARAKTDTRG